MKSTNGGIDSDVLNRLVEILDNHYKHAQICIRDLESKSNSYILSQMIQLKEAFDHIADALTVPRDKETQLKTLDLAEDCLKRASIESIKDLADEIHNSILEILKKPRIYYRLTFFSLPDKSNIEIRLKRIEYHLQRGCQLKDKGDDWKSCLVEFEKAYDEAVTLKNLLPDKDEARYRFFVMLISIIAVVVSVTMTFIFHFM